jgi:retron-type reverse transcriptase
LARVCSILWSNKSTEEIVILNLDINNFFNYINHDWLLKLYPISTKYRHVLKNW